MDINEIFTTSDKVSFVIANDYRLLQVLSRFGISLGFGDKTILEVCEQTNVDPYTFVSVANFVKSRGENQKLDARKLDLSSLLLYLKRTHSYFLEYQFPNMRREMLDAIDCSIKNEVAFLVLKFFDEYVEEVRKHMQFEEDVTFDYVEKLIQGNSKSLKQTTPESNHLLARHHEEIEDKLKELKNLFIQYYPQMEVDNKINSVVYELYRTQEDLFIHCRVEDSIFIPAVMYQEKIAKQKRQRDMETADKQKKLCDSSLSDREKDIVICVAKGMANKEIADKLFLSVNTVTTHRRNIAKKLAIHTPAGITIYAIVNKLVTLEDVNL